MLLENFPDCRARTLRDAEEKVDANVKGSTFSLINKEKHFLFAVNYVRVSGLTLISASCDVECRIDWGPSDFFRQAFQISEGSLLTFDGQTRHTDPSIGGHLVPPSANFKILNSAGYESLTMRVDRDVLIRKLSALIGDDVKDPVFDLSAVSSSGMRALRRSTIELAMELSYFGALVSSPALEELVQSSVVKLLLYQKHNYSKSLFRSEPVPNQKKLDLIIDYIFANWDQPLTIEALARISGIGARTILRLFSKERGTSPAAMIKKIRLEEARNRLLSSDRTGSVLSIALQCGFHSFGHFAREYRLMFGELPSDTLRNRKNCETPRRSSAPRR